eukprot:m.247507 g.247507  ORF g.247507 m.247507 type:complete len:448 (-) comp51439_c0_seq1:596-1939(-)
MSGPTLAEITNNHVVRLKDGGFRPVQPRRRTVSGEDEHCEYGPYFRGTLKARSNGRAVYEGSNIETGIDVAWIEIDRAAPAAQLFSKGDSKVLQSIRHANILPLLTFWETPRNLVLITDFIANGSIREFLRKTGPPRLHVLQAWCRQIVTALNFLHTRRPAIVHRDIHCGSLYVDGRTIKLGSLGTAAVLHDGTAAGIIGLPEFRAPEMYEGPYNESVDVYAFGLAVLQMATMKLPFAECRHNEDQIRLQATTTGPSGFSLIWYREAVDFIRECINPVPAQRPKAGDLRRHPFLQHEVAETPSIRICGCASGTAVDLRLTKLRHGHSPGVSPGGSTLQSIDFTLEQEDSPASVARQLVSEGLIDEAEEDPISSVLALIPQGIATASEGAMVADVAQAYVDALTGADEERQAAVQMLVRQQAQERAQLARAHSQQLRDLLKSRSPVRE